MGPALSCYVGENVYHADYSWRYGQKQPFGNFMAMSLLVVSMSQITPVI
ncbi:hypothetical protein AWT69_003812 [Pseudomonas putida]|nr:hypothetical protein AWT69_003812 [Pseudomonas putida]